MKILRALVLLAVLVGLFLWLDPRHLPPRVTPPEDRTFTVNGIRPGDPPPVSVPEGVNLEVDSAGVRSVRGTQLEENGRMVVRVGSTREEVESSLGGPERTLTDEWIYPGKSFHGQLKVEMEGDRVIWVELTG